LTPDEACTFERQHHLVNGRRCDAKILPDVGFRRRPAMQTRVQVDIRQVLPLLGREGFCGRTHAGHPTQLFVRASRGARMNVRYWVDSAKLNAMNSRPFSAAAGTRRASSSARRFCWLRKSHKPHPSSARGRVSPAPPRTSGGFPASHLHNDLVAPDAAADPGLRHALGVADRHHLMLEGEIVRRRGAGVEMLMQPHVGRHDQRADLPLVAARRITCPGKRFVTLTPWQNLTKYKMRRI
jgi:hypothetical protein